MKINVHFNVSVTSRDLQTSRLGLVSAGEAKLLGLVSVSAPDVSCPSLLVTKPKILRAIFLYRMKEQSFEFSDAKDLCEIPTGSPPPGAPKRVGVGENGDFRPISGYISQKVQNRDIVTMER